MKECSFVIESRKRNLARRAYLAVLVGAGIAMLPGDSMAQYGTQITNAGVQLYTWLRGLGAVIMCLGLAGVGFKLMVSHDREGLKPFFYVIGGGLIMMLAPSFVQLIQGVSGSSAALNTSGS